MKHKTTVSYQEICEVLPSLTYSQLEGLIHHAEQEMVNRAERAADFIIEGMEAARGGDIK